MVLLGRSLRLSIFGAVSTLLLGAPACSVDTTDIFGGGPPNAGGDGTGAGNVGGSGAGNVGGTAPGGSGQGGTTPVGGGGAGGSTTTGPTCGDGTRNANEECDGNDFGGLNCAAFGYVNAAGLVCNDSCTIDAAGCKPECGNGVIEPGEECDGGPGCSGNCTTQTGGTCQQPIQVQLAPNATQTVAGSISGMSTFDITNVGNCQGSEGGETFYRVVPGASGILTAYLPSTDTDFDAVLYTVSGCNQNDTVRACHDNFNTPNGGGEVISFPVENGVPVLLAVDGYTAMDQGPFLLSLNLTTGDNCQLAVPIVVEGDAQIRLLGNTTGMVGDTNSSGNQCNGSGGGPDIVYQILATQDGNYSASTTQSPFNTVLYARSSCMDPNTQITCSNPFGNDAQLQDLQLGAGDTTYVWVDGTTNNSGAYTLVIAH
ncbi:MAG: hypothetical protein U0271_43075 [Polyangiaceae bacterium]